MQEALYTISAPTRIIVQEKNKLILRDDLYQIDINDINKDELRYIVKLIDEPELMKNIINNLSENVVDVLVSYSFLISLKEPNYSLYFHRNSSMGKNYFPWELNENTVIKDNTMSKYTKIDYPKYIKNRKSTRKFNSNYKFPLNKVLYILANAYGFVNDTGKRAIPSAGGLYPLEVFIGIQHVENMDAGLYSVDYSELKLNKILSVESFHECFVGNDINYEDVAFFIFITYKPEKNQNKYGDRGYRFALIESGMISQNIAFCIDSLELGMVNLGSYDESILEKHLLNQESWMVHCVAVGAEANDF
ncbi:SagB/ThcOx family dehydrogenase [Metabacillus indicus]|uniref:SagB/ThcOx family dehydrogenase n=1 Tax=Metabacillus indicus TaxID=246786 RepID=UPI002A06792E|nr:SagB/ThcOx family dehydrogenase [Metabacillus indicus]MDX8288696.1 SagB/ThcOx family dehydrogenase [Metabacillus indicus]